MAFRTLDCRILSIARVRYASLKRLRYTSLSVGHDGTSTLRLAWAPTALSQGAATKSRGTSWCPWPVSKRAPPSPDANPLLDVPCAPQVSLGSWWRVVRTLHSFPSPAQRRAWRSSTAPSPTWMRGSPCSSSGWHRFLQSIASRQLRSDCTFSYLVHLLLFGWPCTLQWPMGSTVHAHVGEACTACTPDQPTSQRFTPPQ